ncbi:MAG: glycosyltransferase [Bacteroides sp.]
MKHIIINTTATGGSIGSITSGLYTYLTGVGEDVRVCYGRGAKSENDDFIKIDSDIETKIHAGLTRLTGLQGYFSNVATSKLLNIIKEYQPDTAILVNLHGYYVNEKRLLNYLKKQGINTIYIMADEYSAMGKCCFSRDCNQYINGCEKCKYIKDYPCSLIFDQAKRIYNRKKKIYQNFENIVFAAPEINIKKVHESAITKGKRTQVVDWGIDLDNVYYIRKDNNIKSKFGIPKEKKMVLAVAPFSDPRKGIEEYFMQVAKIIDDKNICFVQVGFDGDVSICPENYIPISYISNQDELAELYSCADVFVTTSRSDTMPFAALISLACGTPVCCFNTSGLSYLGDESCIYFVEDGNKEDLQRVISTIPMKDNEMQMRCRRYAEERYSDKVFYNKIYELSKSMNSKAERLDAQDNM